MIYFSHALLSAPFICPTCLGLSYLTHEHRWVCFSFVTCAASPSHASFPSGCYGPSLPPLVTCPITSDFTIKYLENNLESCLFLSFWCLSSSYLRLSNNSHDITDGCKRLKSSPGDAGLYFALQHLKPDIDFMHPVWYWKGWTRILCRVIYIDGYFSCFRGPNCWKFGLLNTGVMHFSDSKFHGKWSWMWLIEIQITLTYVSDLFAFLTPIW